MLLASTALFSGEERSWLADRTVALFLFNPYSDRPGRVSFPWLIRWNAFTVDLTMLVVGKG